MSTQSTIKMLTPFDVPVQKSIFDILVVLPVLVRENQLQIFDKAGDLFICNTDAFEESIYQTGNLFGHQSDIWFRTGNHVRQLCTQKRYLSPNSINNIAGQFALN